MDCSADALLQAARCYSCIPHGAAPQVAAYLMCQWANADLGTPYVDAYAAAIAAAGAGSLSASTKTALSTFVNALIGTTVWPKMIALNPVVPDGVNQSLYPLIHNAGLNPWAPYYTGAPTQPSLFANGWEYPSTNNGINTGILPANHWNAASFGVSIYLPVNAHQVPVTLGSAEGVAAQPHTSFYGNQAGNVYCFAHRFGVGLNPAVLPANPWPGFLSVNRTAANLIVCYAARSNYAFNQIGSDATVNTNLPTALWPITVCCMNLAGVPQTSTATLKRISFVAFHQPLTSTEAQTLYNAVQALRTAFGGGYV